VKGPRSAVSRWRGLARSSGEDGVDAGDGDGDGEEEDDIRTTYGT